MRSVMPALMPGGMTTIILVSGWATARGTGCATGGALATAVADAGGAAAGGTAFATSSGCGCCSCCLFRWRTCSKKLSSSFSSSVSSWSWTSTSSVTTAFTISRTPHARGFITLAAVGSYNDPLPHAFIYTFDGSSLFPGPAWKMFSAR